MDLVFTASWSGYYFEASKKSFAPLDDLLPKYAREMTASIDPELLEAARFNGKIFGVPTDKDRGQSGGLVP